MLTAKPKLKACQMPTPDVFITAESVDHGKPHPEPFLTAAKALGVTPEECLVFEDADNGVDSALSAGCLVVVVGDSCRINHPNIVSRISSFDETEFISEENLRIGSAIVGVVTGRAMPGSIERCSP